MSGFFGQILQSVLGGGQQGEASPISGILQQVLTMKDGDNQGIAAVISKLQSAGLGQQVQSWIGSGTNASVTADQIGQAFSPEQIEGWATQAGTTPDALRTVLAQALPHIVDHATPNGDVSTSQTPDISGILGKLMASGIAGFGGSKPT